MLADRIRLRFPPPPPEPTGPTASRTVEVDINGLTWASCEAMEPRILNRLRERLVKKFGEARIERRYERGERVGYVTWVHDDRDVAWLKLTAALLADAARLPAHVLRVRRA